MARVLARQAAARLAGDGVSLIVGAESAEPPGLADAINLNAINRAQAGLLADMDSVADSLYDR